MIFRDSSRRRESRDSAVTVIRGLLSGLIVRARFPTGRMDREEAEDTKGFPSSWKPERNQRAPRTRRSF